MFFVCCACAVTVKDANAAKPPHNAQTLLLPIATVLLL